VRTPVTAEEWEIAEILRKKKPKQIPVFLIGTKAEKQSSTMVAGEFYELGCSDREIFFTSGKEHFGLSELVRATEEEFARRSLPPKKAANQSDTVARIAIVGRPNSGKSTLLNTLSGKEISIVSDIPGTTRDSIDSEVRFEKETYLLIDTAGVRKKSQMHRDEIERHSRLRTLNALMRADLAIFLVSVEDGITHQDQSLADEIVEAGIGVVVVFSKWDLLRKQGQKESEEEEENKIDLVSPEKIKGEAKGKIISKTVAELRSGFLREAKVKLPFLSWAPVLFLSAVEKRGIHEIFNTAREVMSERTKKIPTHELNEFLEQALQLHPPASRKKIMLKVKYCTQTGVNPPTFAFFVNDPDAAHFSFIRFLENRLREVYGFWGTPIRIEMKKK